MVKSCERDRSRPDEIDTKTEICTSLQSEFYFRFCWPPSTKSTLISYISIQVFVTIRGKICPPHRETAKIGFCASLKSVIYFLPVCPRKNVAFETTTFLSGVQNYVKIGKELRTYSFDNRSVDRHTETKVIVYQMQWIDYITSTVVFYRTRVYQMQPRNGQNSLKNVATTVATLPKLEFAHL